MTIKKSKDIKMRVAKKIIYYMVILSFLYFVSCSTMQGTSKETEKNGREIQKAAESHNHSKTGNVPYTKCSCGN